jgi:hypothetical protein
MIAFVAAIGTYGIWQEWWIAALWFSLFLILVMLRYISGREARSESLLRGRGAFAPRC